MVLLRWTGRRHCNFKAENNPLTEIAWNKNTTRKQYTDLGDSGGLYRRKLYIETKSQEETGTETRSRVVSPQGGAAWGGPAPPSGEEPPDSVSCLFSSRDFSYLIKTTKILIEKSSANLFWLELFPIWKRTLQVPANCPGWILPEKLFQ
jgi:hypothetical protein